MGDDSSPFEKKRQEAIERLQEDKVRGFCMVVADATEEGAPHRNYGTVQGMNDEAIELLRSELIKPWRARPL